MTAYSDLVAADGAICHLPLDGSATSLVDTTGHGTDGTLAGTGTLIWNVTTGPIAGEGYLQFTGSGWIDLARPALFPVAGAFSYEVWVRASGLFLREALWQVGGSGTPDPLVHAALDGNTSQLILGNAAGDYVFGTTLDVSPWPWSHVVAVTDGASGSIYVDGVPLTDDHSTGTLPLNNDPTWVAAAVRLAATLTGTEGCKSLLAHAAAYPVALTPCQVLSHYDLGATGSYTPCRQWVRLAHVSGQGYWQSTGELIEEHASGHKARDHDGTTSTVYSADVPVLQTPLAVLLTSPPNLVGKDPATNLPAYCPPPPVVAIAPTPPATPPTTVDPNEFRCNIAHYVAGQMELAYGYAAAKINTMNSAQWTLIALGGPLAGVILALLNVAFPPLMIVTGFGVGLIALLGSDRQTSELLPLGGPAVEAMAKALYCALVPDSAGQFQITGTTLFNWSYNLTSFGADFSGNQLAEVRLLITVYQPAYWAQLAIQAGASGSTLCGGYSCSGLLP